MASTDWKLPLGKIPLGSCRLGENPLEKYLVVVVVVFLLVEVVVFLAI